MQNLTFSVGIFPSKDAGEAVNLAVVSDEAGYDAVWVGDSHMIWRELYVLMGYIAAKTRRVLISPGVTQLLTRHPTVTASALITLAELAPDRVRLGLGLGDSSVMNIGKERADLGMLSDGVRVFQRLCAGQGTPINGHEGKITFASGSKIPVYIASHRRRVLEFAGATADGVILAGDSDTLSPRIETVRRAQREAGRSVRDVKIVWWRACCISQENQEAREAVKPMVARAAMSELKRKAKIGELNAEEREVLTLLQKHYDFYHHMGPEHSRLVPDAWVDRYALAGSPSEILARIQETLKEGIDEISIIPFGEDRDGIVTQFARGVMRALRRSA